MRPNPDEFAKALSTISLVNDIVVLAEDLADKEDDMNPRSGTESCKNKPAVSAFAATARLVLKSTRSDAEDCAPAMLNVGPKFILSDAVDLAVADTSGKTMLAE